MIVSLPNGLVVHMSVETYLELDEWDVRQMIAQGCGSVASSPWCGSAIKKPGRLRIKDEDIAEHENEGLSEEELELDDDTPDPLANEVDEELEVPRTEE